MPERVVIHWFRRDLRLTDNLALEAACASGARVVPLFVFDPAILRSPRTGAPRLAFMLRALHALDASLRRQGSSLLVRHRDPAEVLPALARQLGAEAVYANRDYSPFARRRDDAVERALAVPLHSYDDALLRPPGTVVKQDGEPYVVYTPFKRQWRALPRPSRPLAAPSEARPWHTLAGLPNDGVPTLEALGFGPTIAVPEASEAYAQQRLALFAEQRLGNYAEARNFLVPDPFAASPPHGPSYLSPYLRLGILSPRQVFWAAQDVGDHHPKGTIARSVTAWIDELIWREFYMHILYHFPHVARGNFRREYDVLAWRDAPDELAAWQDGQTGYPIVDAAMRQLAAVGWMPNRARMIVASFLTKDLLIDWRAGELHFMQWLIDGDPAANNGGWQWAAGTGTDAQPYFRIFNPVSQSERFDPAGAYIRSWVPELRDMPSRAIHAPWQADERPRSYPPPIVDHAFARERTLAAFRLVKGDA